MPIILECRHRLWHKRAFLAGNRGQSRFDQIYDGPSFNYRVHTSSRREDFTATDMGKSQEAKKYYLANQLKNKRKKKKFQGIHDRFLRDHEFRVRMIENHRDEDVCRRWDALADEDHTYHLSEEEYFYNKNRWWFHLNKSCSDTLPLRKCSDFKQALSTFERLHQEAGGEQLAPILYWKNKQWKSASSLSSTWWEWQDSWWSSLNSESQRRGKQSLGKERRDTLFTVLWQNPLKMALRIHSILLQIDRLQLTAVYCNRREV